MKKIYATAFASILIGSMASCSKSTTNKTTPSTSSSSYMTATINGAAFSASLCLDTFDRTHLILAISGGSGYSEDTGFAYPYISINLQNYASGIGSYTFYSGSGGGGGIDSGNSNIFSAALYGEITITAITPNLIGTFSFTCLDSTKVTNGSFKCKGI